MKTNIINEWVCSST